jgi:hypothetical protein
MLCPKCGFEIAGVRPRTVGKFSQSAHLHGHLQQIARHTGYTLGEIKEVMKEDMVDWPRHEVKLGGVIRLVPISEADADTVSEAAAIEWTHVKAAELGVRLVEAVEP